MDDKGLVIINLVLLVALLYGYYNVTVTGKLSTFTKWLIAVSGMAIMIIMDKVMGVLFILSTLLIKALLKRKNNGLERT
jgi:hypothetical protein